MINLKIKYIQNVQYKICLKHIYKHAEGLINIT